eukprot:CAMPEP_0204839702 /NCGR_PEP_ID=MMETSP1346-20131115/35182_1 /ASSEMBLY_ACC=CAM_ASM_000771 /TAXON_ID=215587 /ORGANISM="Aplanochytrium stocchinoi, Strain GSBS06" /LENGTH=471 /DNA_ID=CAMNT_0051976619 /DNA_START=146 /DNA_END=1558 /DNA_ORIENTATION=+
MTFSTSRKKRARNDISTESNFTFSIYLPEGEQNSKPALWFPSKLNDELVLYIIDFLGFIEANCLEYVGQYKQILPLVPIRLVVTNFQAKPFNLIATCFNSNNLKQLDLRYNGIGHEAFSLITPALHNLQHINLQYNDLGTAGAYLLAAVLKKNTSIRYLDLRQNNIGDAGLHVIADALESNKSLKHLFLEDEATAGTNALMAALSSNSTLVELGLYYGVFISDFAANLLANALCTGHVHLKRLEFRGNFLQPDGVKAISKALDGIKKSELEDLMLDYQPLGKEGGVALSHCLKTNPILVSISLKDTGLEDEGAAALAEALKGNNTLKCLGLQCNTIKLSGISALACALKHNQGLEQLDLSYNFIGDEGVPHLSDALKCNNSLKRLGLISNQIGNSGAIVLADALRTNMCLSRLCLGHNLIDDTGAIAIAELLLTNRYLKEVNLLNNKLGSLGQECLEEVLLINTGIERLVW